MTVHVTSALKWPPRLACALAALLLAASCHETDASRDRNVARSSELVAPTYADRGAHVSASPSGLYWEGERLWVYSDAHRTQRSYVELEGHWQVGPTRTGPSGTQRCLVGRAALSGRTYCVGRYQNAGLVAFEAGDVTARPFGALPARAGFRDVVLLHEHGLIGVLDAVADQLVWLDRAGTVTGRLALAPSSYRVGAAGEDGIFVLSGTRPALLFARVDVAASTQVVARWERDAPLRDAVYDAVSDLLWIAGPEAARVRRHRGPIEHLGSELAALDGAALRRGEIAVRAHFDLQPRGLADPTRLVSFDGQLVASLTGSDALAWVARAGDGFQLTVRETGLAPADLASGPGVLAVATRLDDAVHLHPNRTQSARAQPSAVIAIDAFARDTPRDVGERLFYRASLWSQSQRTPYTCNSCHWETEVDFRQHPGLRESRFEQTRPVGGVGALTPLFTPGQAPTLARAVDGFVRILDDRYWHDPEFEERPIEVRLKDDALRRFSPGEVRRALIAFLASVPVSPGPYLRAADADVRAAVARGAQLFGADCADCHAPRDERGHKLRLSPEALLARSAQRPLVLGADGFASSGPGPSFNPFGNRIAPLMGLSRGGPYFSSGSAATLREVIEGFTRERPRVHAGGRRGTYDAAQAAALEAFLRTL